jgi:hypothetical protein
MNIDGLNMVNTFAGYEAKKIVANPAKTVNSYACKERKEPIEKSS